MIGVGALVLEVGQDSRVRHRTGELVALQVAERSASMTATHTHSRVRSGSWDRLNAGPVKLQRAAVKTRRRETLAAGGSQPEIGLSSSCDVSEAHDRTTDRNAREFLVK